MRLIRDDKATPPEVIKRAEQCDRIPSELNSQNSACYSYVTPKLQKLRNQLIAEVLATQPSQPNTATIAVPPAPIGELIELLPTVLAMTDELQRMREDKFLGSYSEMNWRAPIDTLLRRALQDDPKLSTFRVGGKNGAEPTIDSGWFLIFWQYYNKVHHLPGPQYNMIAENTTIMTAFQTEYLCALQLVCEFKRVKNGIPDHRVAFDLGAAQGQLKTLGLKDRIV
ncbi:hypothetical protein FRB95_005366 [Tulasnella sp. JGI-2019a]|nr:hypothetical protein FRB95_005366 [Tulasnella sp. JGI-2019a]